MTTSNMFLALYLGSKSGVRAREWNALSQTERTARGQQGVVAWKAWADEHQDVIVAAGGPLGKTRKISPSGIEDVSNELVAYTVVRAESHEAAARIFERHPHFTIFPGDSVEIMPVLPIPGT